MADVGRGISRSRGVLVGVGIVVIGVVVALLGLGGAGAFDVSIKSFAFDSTSTGLAIVAVGGGLIAGLSPGRPAPDRGSVQVSGVAVEDDRRLAALGTLVMGLGLVLYVASILF